MPLNAVRFSGVSIEPDGGSDWTIAIMGCGIVAVIVLMVFAVGGFIALAASICARVRRMRLAACLTVCAGRCGVAPGVGIAVVRARVLAFTAFARAYRLGLTGIGDSGDSIDWDADRVDAVL